MLCRKWSSLGLTFVLVVRAGASTAEAADVAAPAEVRSIVEEINRLPGTRQLRNPRLEMPVFSAKVLAEYRTDYPSWEALQAFIAAEPKKFALRKAVLEAMAALNQSHELKLLERIPSPKGTLPDAKAKVGFMRFQNEAGLKILDLQLALDKLKMAGELRVDECKRWQAHYDFAVARLLARTLFLFEYNFAVGSLRLDGLPDLEIGVHKGWRLVSRKEPLVVSKEFKVKDLAKQVKRSWKRIADDYPETPWAVNALHEQVSDLGLQWQASKD
jgi:hypothetical protein